MAELHGEDVCFVGLGKSVPSWYRCALPAYNLGCHWIGYMDRPPNGTVATGNTMYADLNPALHRVWIVQQPRGREWAEWIDAVHLEGGKVLFETDDYLHGVKMLANPAGEAIPVSKEILNEWEMCLARCDGIVCSTDYIAQRYQSFGPTWVCRNGIDTRRFNRKRRDHERPNIGWFGGSGHDEAVDLWAPQVRRFCNEEDLWFYSVGTQYDCWDGIDKLVRIPFVPIEQVPDVLAHIDIGLAPAVDTPFYRGKSDLRVLEGAAAGIAMLSDYRTTYSMVPPQATWFTEGDSEDGVYAELHGLVNGGYDDSRDPWQYLQETAREWVVRERDASVTAGDWEVPLTELSKEL